MEDFTVDINGTQYTVQYAIFDDDETQEEMLRVILPDDSERTTVLRGLKIGSVIRTHVASYDKASKESKNA